MENNKDRKTLINELLEKIYKEADHDERDLIINNNWGLTADEAVQKDYPDELKEELMNEYFPQHDIMSEFYAPLIKAIIAYELSEANNKELIEMYRAYTGITVGITDPDKADDRKLYVCPCCHNNTLSERGQYFICPVCDWEDDGLDENHVSHCNGMKLSEAQIRYQKTGTIY